MLWSTASLAGHRLEVCTIAIFENISRKTRQIRTGSSLLHTLVNSNMSVGIQKFLDILTCSHDILY